MAKPAPGRQLPHLRGVKVVVLKAARRKIETEIHLAGRVETGGALLGWRQPEPPLIVVAAATGPGRRAKQTPTSLVLDTHEIQDEIDAAFAATSGAQNFLGDWHLHHEARPKPSNTDRASLAELVSDLGMQDALLIIVGRGGRGRLDWRAWRGADMSPVHLDLR